jgi:hypothetical protein
MKLSCPCCLEPEMRVKFDKHSRPYLRCDSCLVRMFPAGQHARAISGLLLLTPMISARAEAIRSDRDAWSEAQSAKAHVTKWLTNASTSETSPTNNTTTNTNTKTGTTDA